MARSTTAAAVLRRLGVGMWAAAAVAPALGLVAAAVSVVEIQRRWKSSSGDGFHRLAKIEIDLEIIRTKSSSKFPVSCDGYNLRSFLVLIWLN